MAQVGPQDLQGHSLVGAHVDRAVDLAVTTPAEAAQDPIAVANELARVDQGRQGGQRRAVVRTHRAVAYVAANRAGSCIVWGAWHGACVHNSSSAELQTIQQRRT